MRYALLGVALTALAPGALASLWDDDRLAAEAEGLPPLVRVITGRFARNPPLFYEMRRNSARTKLQTQPNCLLAYDIAGVACDLLGRDDEAIAWMERKNFQIGTMVLTGIRTRDDMRDHSYRALANLGTFWLHRWIRTGARRSRIDELRTARFAIANAIDLSPYAHFDRERYQLRMLDRILTLPEYKTGRLPPLLDLDDPTNRTPAACRALAGLIVLGNDSESVDLFNTLAQVLERTEQSRELALMARLRCRELIDEGQCSLVPGAPTDPGALARAIGPLERPGTADEGAGFQAVCDTYRLLRAEAESWQAARTAFLMRRLQEGLLPSTGPGFWTGYHEKAPPPVTIPTLLPRGEALHSPAPTRLSLIGLGLLAGTLLPALLTWLLLRRASRADPGRRVRSRGAGVASLPSRALLESCCRRP